MEDRGSKLKGGSYSSLEHFQELVTSATQFFKSYKYPKFVRGLPGDVVDVGLLAEVAGDGQTQQPGLVDHFQWLRIGEA